MSVVRFNVDIFPYCKGDVVKLEGDHKKALDSIIKDRNLADAYSELKADKKPAAPAAAAPKAKASKPKAKAPQPKVKGGFLNRGRKK